MFTASTYSFFVIGFRAELKGFHIAGVYSMIFKLPAHGEDIRDPLDIYIVLTMIFHPPSYFLKEVERR